MNSTLLTSSKGSSTDLSQLRDRYFQKYERDPLAWAYDYLDIPDRLWAKQEEIIASVFEHTYTAVRSGYSTGKTFASAVASLTFLYTRYPSKVITTAPTFRQVGEILWRDIRKLHAGAKIQLSGTLLNIKLDLDKDWFAIGLHPREYDLNAFQGFHSENILIILDESPGITEDLYRAARSLMASGDAHLLEIGNPTEVKGHFYDAFDKKESAYHKIHVSCLDSPNLQNGRSKRPYLVTRKWVEEQRRDYGEDSIEWQCGVLGDFPSSERVSFVPREWVKRSFDMEDFDV